MPDTKLDPTDVKSRVTEAQAKATKANDEGRDLTADERTFITAAVTDAKALKAQEASAASDRELMADAERFAKGIFDTTGHLPATKTGSFGDRFVEGLGDYLKGLTPGGTGTIGEKTRVHSPAVKFAGLADLFGRKDILSSGDGGPVSALVPPDFRGLLDAGVHERPLTVADLVTRGRTTSDAISYARVSSVTNNAAAVAEASGTSAGDASGDVSGTKPESDIVTEAVTDTVKTIAHWIAMTKRALSDVAQVATMADGFLRYGLEEQLEDQILSGDGTGENFEGILTVSGTQAQAFDTDIFVTVRKAITKARKNGRARNISVLVSVEDEEAIDLLRDGNDRFFGNGPFGIGPATLWGRRLVATEALSVGQAIVGDFTWATLWDREDIGVMLFDQHADFAIRNLVAMLAEMRAGFGVIRPSAFVITDTAA